MVGCTALCTSTTYLAFGTDTGNLNSREKESEAQDCAAGLGGDASTAFPAEDAQVADAEIDVPLCLVRHVRAEGAPAHHVPCRRVMLVHVLFDRIIDGITCHGFRHLLRLDRRLRVLLRALERSR